MEPFIVVNITDIDQLYGRKRQIEILKSCAKRKSNAGIIGARRFGKTCILRSMESFLRLHPEYNAYPLYFDSQKTGITKDSSEVYRTIASMLAAQMCADNILPEGEYKISRRCSLDVSDDMLDMIVQMKSWNTEYQKEVLFVLTDIMSQSNKYVLLLLDEIEHLLTKAMAEPSDFARIRDAASEKDSKLKFWVAGVASWSAICNNTGSLVLNCGLENITLPLLSYDEFAKMWTNACLMIDDINERDRFQSLINEMYSKTGGVPYYSKFVGSHMLINNLLSIPNYEIVRDYLAEIVNSPYMSEVERSMLYQLAKAPLSIKDTKPDGISGIETKGLLKLEGNSYSIGMGYLSDYLNACKQDIEVTNIENIELQELNSLVDQISRLMKNVNVVYKGSEPFTASMEDHQEYNTLKKMCYNESTMDAFSGSIYKLYYEGSNCGDDLPNGFKLRNFCKMVRTLRHKYNHRECDTSNMMTMEELMGLINGGREPFKKEDFSSMQKKMLDAFQEELLSMIKKKKGEGTDSNVRYRLAKGIYHEGMFGKKHYVVQDGTGFIQQVRKIRDGESPMDGDKVEYSLGCEQNTNDPERKFWYAIDVHLI